jgi:transportin-1
LLLKNSINARDLSQENASEGEKQAVAYVKSTILAGLQDKDQMIRQTVGAVITSLLTAEQPGGWPEALEALTTGKGSQDMNVVEVSYIHPARVYS